VGGKPKKVNKSPTALSNTRKAVMHSQRFCRREGRRPNAQNKMAAGVLDEKKKAGHMRDALVGGGGGGKRKWCKRNEQQKKLPAKLLQRVGD